MKQLCITVVAIFLSFGLIGQDQNNYILTNYSFAFFGTGDLSGSSMGLNYHKSLKGRFGVNLGLAKASGSGEGILGVFDNDRITNVNFTGNGSSFPAEIASYTTYIIGANYKVSDGAKQTLLTSIGYNFKNVKYTYVGSVFTTSEGMSEVAGYNSVSENEGGLYIALDWMYYVAGDVSLGVHLAMENSDNLVSKAGLSMGFRF